jgi:hypothetical protein
VVYDTIKSSYKKSPTDARTKRLPYIVKSISQTILRPALFVFTLSLFSWTTALTGQVLAKEPKVGRFVTNFGPVVIYQGKQDRLAGFYYYKGLPAHLFLRRNDKGSYKGIWVQAASEQKCATKKNGSPFWGTINAAFKNGKFLALWNYCNAALVNKKNRQWKGALK